MLVKINNITGNIVKVTQLDIDDYGSIIPIKELELKLLSNDNSIIQTLKSSSYAAIFTEGNNNNDDNSNTIILASSITNDELNEEKIKTINTVNKK
ncbi:MAG TPA: hypothetical protein VE244_10805 [Nitrososphaeraceae archaeon]|jgi:hypothetical protein|nr:hypothetical protein [Nitrososphaeraceae archaeon]